MSGLDAVRSSRAAHGSSAASKERNSSARESSQDDGPDVGEVRAVAPNKRKSFVASLFRHGLTQQPNSVNEHSGLDKPKSFVAGLLQRRGSDGEFSGLEPEPDQPHPTKRRSWSQAVFGKDSATPHAPAGGPPQSLAGSPTKARSMAMRSKWGSIGREPAAEVPAHTRRQSLDARLSAQLSEREQEAGTSTPSRLVSWTKALLRLSSSEAVDSTCHGPTLDQLVEGADEAPPPLSLDQMLDEQRDASPVPNARNSVLPSPTGSLTGGFRAEGNNTSPVKGKRTSWTGVGEAVRAKGNRGSWAAVLSRRSSEESVEGGDLGDSSDTASKRVSASEPNKRPSLRFRTAGAT